MKLLTSLHLIFSKGEQLAVGGGGGGQHSKEEEDEEELELQQEEEGHYEGEARYYEDEVVGVMDLPQDLHPHVDPGLATSFALL
jgi:hypothetical protein